MSRFAKNITDLATLYGIYDPKDGQCIYVGFTTRKKQRWQDHRSYLRRGKHPNQQLQRLWDKRGGLRFGLLTTGTVATVLHAEKAEIAKLRSQIGDRLCNATEGGEGTPGMPKHVRDRIAANSRARWQDPEYRKRWEAATGGKVTGRQRNARFAWIMGKRTKLAPKPKKAKAPKPKPKKYTRDDLVAITCGDVAIIPAVRKKRRCWMKVGLDRVKDFVGHKWCIRKHHNGYQAKRSDGKRVVVATGPYSFSVDGQNYQITSKRDRYSAGLDTVSLTAGDNAFVPATRMGTVYWCKIPADRIEEFHGFLWHLKLDGAKLRMARKSGHKRVEPRQPYSVLATAAA